MQIDDEATLPEPEAPEPAVEGVEPAAPAATPPAAPAPIVARMAPEDLAALGSVFAQSLVSANQQMRANQPAAEAPIDDVTDQEIDERLARGESAAAFVRRAINAATERAKREVKAEIAAIRAEGSQALSQLSRASLETQKFYKDYKAEVDAAIASLPVEMQAQPQAILNTYRYICGLHADEIDAKAEERAIRKTRESAPAAPAGQVVRPRDGRELDPAKVLGPELYEAAQALGGPEKFAKMLGYDTVDAWLKADWVDPEEKH